MQRTEHVPVMVNEVVEALSPRSGGIYVDGTFGGGGYTRALLNSANCSVLALDRDPAAIGAGRSLEAQFSGRLYLAEARFSEMEGVAHRLGYANVDGVALDLGMSSDQLADRGRGFSFARGGPLDMRMGRTGPTAADLLNTLPESTLADIFRTLGEEPNARKIARYIVSRRASEPFATTDQLVRAIEHCCGSQHTASKIHPATRVFQALRVAVNDELFELAEGLAAAERLIAPEGRLAVVSFHSLEDRIVKRFFAQRSGTLARPSRHAPLDAVDAPLPSFALLFRSAQRPSSLEVARNARARSARLRAAIRTKAPPIPIDPNFLGVTHIHLSGVGA